MDRFTQLTRRAASIIRKLQELTVLIDTRTQTDVHTTLRSKTLPQPSPVTIPAAL
jgi:hypothetical protein